MHVWGCMRVGNIGVCMYECVNTHTHIYICMHTKKFTLLHCNHKKIKID